MEGSGSSRAAVARQIPNGAPKPAAFPSSSAPYQEIFGGAACPFAIPVLDLPPAPAEAAGALVIDYFEIFGAASSSNGGEEFAPHYEELVASENRFPEERGFYELPVEVTELPSEGLNGDHLIFVEKDQMPVNADHSNVPELNYGSHHKMCRGGEVDTVTKTTTATQPNDFPGSSFAVEAWHCSQNMKYDHPPDMENNDLSQHEDLKVEIAEGSQGKIFKQNFYCGPSREFEDEQEDDLKCSTKNTFSEDGNADLKQHSCSSSYHSTSSGDIAYPDYTFITISGVNLQTQPLPVPPPSRSPPKLNGKRGHSGMKMATTSKAGPDEGIINKHATKSQNYGRGVYKHRARQVSMKDNSSSNSFGVEIDASSAAAAMKEAMEQAQARLKSAKESMEGKLDNFQGHKRLSQNDIPKCRQSMGDRVSEEIKSVSKEMVQEASEKDSQISHFFTLEERQKSLIAPNMDPDVSEKGTYFVFMEEGQQTMQGKEPTTSRTSSKLDKRNEEWKADKEFHELINNEKKLKAVRELSEQGASEKKFVFTTVTKEDNGNEKKMSKLTNEYKTVECKAIEQVSEMECCRKQLKAIAKDAIKTPNENILRKVTLGHHRSREFVTEPEAGGNVNESTITVGQEEEIKEIREAMPKSCVKGEKMASGGWVPERTENKLEEPLEILQQNGIKSVQHHEAHVCAENERKFSSAEQMHGYSDKTEMLKAYDENCKLKEVNKTEKDMKVVTAKQAHGCGENIEESDAAYLAFEVDKSKKLTLSDKVSKQQNKKEVKLVSVSSMNEVVENMNADLKNSQCEKLMKTREPSDVASSPESANLTLEEDENKFYNEPHHAYNWKRNEKKTKIEVSFELDESEKRHKAARVVVGDTVSGKEKEENEEACEQVWNEDNIREAKLEHRQHMQKASEASSKLDICEKKLKVVWAEGWDTVSEKEKEVPKDACKQACNEIEVRGAQLEDMQNENRPKASQVSSKLENCENKLTKDEGEERQEEHDFINQKNDKMFNTDPEIYKEIKYQNLRDVQRAILSEEKEKKLNQTFHASETCVIREKENIIDMQKEDERKKEEEVARKKEQEIEQLRKLEEDKEREREREKDRLAVEKATHEACDRAVVEARESAERIAVERATAEARQRALAEAREKAEKVSTEAKSVTEKDSREARLKMERAAVERATAEARERAIERAIAEKAAAETRERTERSVFTSTDRLKKDSEAFRSSNKQDSRIGQPTFDVRDGLREAQFHAGAGGESGLRYKARLERHQRTSERAAKALAEKNMRDAIAQREQEERNRLAESLDADVRRWSNGKEGNLRALLSTLQYILGAESGWQPIPLTDVITAAAAKKAYRKATLYVHPDKLQQRGASIQQKYVCEKVFDLLKEAWSRFNSEER